MNLAEPSGSSAAENPPANMRIFARSMLATISLIDAEMSIVRNGTTLVTAPAASNAFAVSYSQFVPGNTGIYTKGVATRCGALICVLEGFVSTASSSVFWSNKVG